MDDKSHRTIWGGGASLGLSAALSGYQPHEDSGSDDDDSKRSRSLRNSVGKATRRQPLNIQEPDIPSYQDNVDEDFPARRKSNVHFKESSDSEHKNEDPSSDFLTSSSFRKNSTKRASDYASVASSKSSIHIVPEAPKLGAFDEFPEFKPRHRVPQNIYGKKMNDTTDREITIDDDSYANFEYHGNQVGSLFLSNRMFEDRDELRALIQKNRGGRHFFSEDAYNTDDNVIASIDLEVNGSGQIRELAASGLGRKLPDSMPIFEVMHAIAKTHDWTEEEVQQDLIVLTKYRIRNVQSARSLSMPTWDQMTDLLPNSLKKSCVHHHPKVQSQKNNMEATSVPQQFRMIDFTIYRDANGNAFVAYTPTPALTFNPPQPTTPEISCLAPSFFYATPPRATPTITSPLPISTHDQPFTFPTFTLSPEPFNMNPLIPESPLQAQPEPPSLTSKSLPTPSKTPTSTKPRVACKFQDCGKTFSSVSHLNRHMKIHTGNRQIICGSML
ncbi:hypothetical protein HDU79_002836 [Rhizoclosmatium sp. JEL0117]|nr:hypothetical protein HDU79_002836 [Rhizoclosmatium sp. JEL0117]